MENLADFIFELATLKKQKRTGWWLVGIKNPESVAEHSHMATVIAYILGRLENVNAERAAVIALFNDVSETRIGDLHKVAQRYVGGKEVEKKVVKEQLASLPDEIKDSLSKTMEEFYKENTKEGIIARDADLLENAFQAKEYIEQGYKECQGWINNVRKLLKTKSAKILLELMEKQNSTDWFKGLKNIKR